ncbi:1271_t:CDS:2 [Cetraspora pellucida]|uniref:1271_t:CDS:1 n=1 Tax=Cetraspora pellucida TaxID=1433469 RepID=A0ACA9MFI5_9GLOM|nr:1271_t:CDS:2 [Cetraspora pellucida]
MVKFTLLFVSILAFLAIATTMIYADTTTTTTTTPSDCTACADADSYIRSCTNSTAETLKNVPTEITLKCTCQQSFINGYASCFKCPVAVEYLTSSKSPQVSELIASCASNNYTGLIAPK